MSTPMQTISLTPESHYHLVNYVYRIMMPSRTLGGAYDRAATWATRDGQKCMVEKRGTGKRGTKLQDW